MKYRYRKPFPIYYPQLEEVGYHTNFSIAEITKFLWLPKVIDGEIRWLERATYHQWVQSDEYGTTRRSFKWVSA